MTKRISNNPMGFKIAIKIFHTTEKGSLLLETSNQMLTSKTSTQLSLTSKGLKPSWQRRWVLRGWAQTHQVRNHSVRTLAITWCQFWKIGNNQMTHSPINQIKNSVSKKNNSSQILIWIAIWKLVLAENCNCPTLEASNSTATHTRIHLKVPKDSETSCLTSINSSKSMKIMFLKRQLNILKMDRMSSRKLRPQLRHVSNTSDAAHSSSLSTVEIIWRPIRKISKRHQTRQMRMRADSKGHQAKYWKTTYRYSRSNKQTKMNQLLLTHISRIRNINPMTPNAPPTATPQLPAPKNECWWTTHSQQTPGRKCPNSEWTKTTKTLPKTKVAFQTWPENK